jgi:hypothetical protein
MFLGPDSPSKKISNGLLHSPLKRTHTTCQVGLHKKRPPLLSRHEVFPQKWPRRRAFDITNSILRPSEKIVPLLELRIVQMRSGAFL